VPLQINTNKRVYSSSSCCVAVLKRYHASETLHSQIPLQKRYTAKAGGASPTLPRSCVSCFVLCSGCLSRDRQYVNAGCVRSRMHRAFSCIKESLSNPRHTHSLLNLRARAPHPPSAPASYAVYPLSASNDTLLRISKPLLLRCRPSNLG